MSRPQHEYLQLAIRGCGVSATTEQCIRAWSDMLAATDAKGMRNVLVDAFDIGPFKAEKVVEQMAPFRTPL